jgi:hypothetical protein
MPSALDNITYSVKWDNMKTKERNDMLIKAGCSTNWKWRFWSFIPAHVRDDLVYRFKLDAKTGNTDHQKNQP